VEALGGAADCAVCRNCQGKAYLPKKEDALLLSWKANGSLSVPKLVIDSVTPEQQRAVEQKDEDLRSGVYYKRAPRGQTMYRDQVRQQGE